jgi:hypothetical protein
MTSAVIRLEWMAAAHVIPCRRDGAMVRGEGFEPPTICV